MSKDVGVAHADSMHVEALLAACARMEESPQVNDLRGVTYLASYPALIEAAHRIDLEQRSGFIHLATLVYGWMPRVVRVRLDGLDAALEQIRVFKPMDPVDQVVGAVAAVLSSVVGASKWLHFWRPDCFPIWDSRIEQSRLGWKPSPLHMGKVGSYVAYRDELLAGVASFPRIRAAFEPAFVARLRCHGLEPYEVSDLRMVEYLVFDGKDEADDTPE